MTIDNRLESIIAARLFVEKHFPDCQVALLAGSVVRAEATFNSDLDIVILKETASSYRESLIEFGWPIEVFVHSLLSYKLFFESDCKRARPSLPRMVAEGIVLKDVGVLEEIKQEARMLLKKGPEKWTAEIIEMKRYSITDTLDDFIGSYNRSEDIFIANALADQLSEFILRVNQQWIGASKWVFRSLRDFDEAFAAEFMAAFDLFYKTGEKIEVIQLAERILQPYGGRLFDGFSVGKK